MSDAASEVAGRYSIEATLGEGGMGAVFRAHDRRSGRTVALKRLRALGDHRRDKFEALFQREFHTLAQLAHPSVIEVFDYGVDADGPYYTMELLTGEDLFGRAPLPYRRVCALLHDIASSLSLLHSRRLVHRDVSSRNVRIVGPERAKLIDFGALVPAGPCDEIVGTPMFIAPEAVLVQPLDGRYDLYSLGVVLYHALSRRFPYRAKRIHDLRKAWLQKPVPIGRLVEGLPVELERLTMSLIALDRTARPRDAAEVMERLAGIGELERPEPAAASRAYLVAPNLVGRGKLMQRARELLIKTLRGSGGGLWISGPAGVGRSRMRDACALEAKVLGALVLRTATPSGNQPFGTLQALLDQMVQIQPDVVASARDTVPRVATLFERAVDGGTAPRPRLLAAPTLERAKVIAAFAELCSAMVRHHAMVIAVDDVHKMDEPSVAALATALQDAAHKRLMVIATANSEALTPEAVAYRVLENRSAAMQLDPLEPVATRELMRSLFGKVPNVEVIAERIHRLCHGRPRDAIALAEHLVDRGVIRYRGGSWVLPSSLDAGALPSSMADSMREVLSGLSPLARQLADLQACCAQTTLRFEQHIVLCADSSAREVYAALDELLTSDVLVATVHGYAFRHEGWLALLREELTTQAASLGHLALARMHEAEASEPLMVAYHRLLGGDESGALALLGRFAVSYTDQAVDVFDKTELGPVQLGELFDRALAAADRLGASARLRSVLDYFSMAMGVFVDATWFDAAAPGVLARLKRESGFDAWHTLDPTMEPLARALTALQMAQATYDALPEDQRSRPPVESIQHMVQFAAASIAVGVRSYDARRLRSLPALLEPFAALTPIVGAILENTQATCESTYARHEQARKHYAAVLERLSGVETATLDHADEIRDAVRYGIAVSETRLGIPDACQWLEPLDKNPRHHSTCHRLRSIVCLQRGDWEGARRHTEQAEQIDMESAHRPIFGGADQRQELELYALGLDLGAVKQIVERLAAISAKLPGWLPYLHSARGEYEHLRGNLDAALAAFRLCVQMREPASTADAPDASWFGGAAGELEVLVELDRLDEAQAAARRALSFSGGDTSGVRYLFVLRAVALVEARCGRSDEASHRLEQLIDERRAAGTRGVYLGVLYEALALVALWRRDLERFKRYVELTAAEFLQVPNSGLTGRYQRLLDSAREASLLQSDEILDLGPAATAAPTAIGASIATRVTRTLRAVRDAKQRAELGLQLLCEQAGSDEGYLYLLRDTGLAHAATRSDLAPDPGLKEFLFQCLSEEVESRDAVTVASDTHGSGVVPHAGAIWVGEDGRCLHRVFICAQLGAESTLVGVAALCLPRDARLRKRVTEVASALGNYFLQSGDAVADLVSMPMGITV